MTKTRQIIQIGLGSLVVLFALLPFFANLDANDNHLNFANHNYGKNLMNTLEPNSVFMTEGGDNQVFTSAYNQMAMQLRPDVRIYDQKGNVFYRIYGDFRYLTQQEVDIKRDIVDFEIFSRGRPVYLTWKRTPDVAVCGDWFLKRYGILFKVVPLKYRILEDLDADRELDLAQVETLLKKYYQGPQISEKQRKNAKDLDWYQPALLGLTSQSPHFISDDERDRLRRAVVEYQAWLETALDREIDRNFTLRLLAELEDEGYLSLVGTRVRFLKDIPAPIEGDYWSRYVFDYQNVENAVEWDYLAREILTNYNFYYAEYCREMLEKLNRQRAYYLNRVKQGFDERAALAEITERIRYFKSEEEKSYREAAYYGYDMAAIHHNLGATFLQRGELSKAVASFRRGMIADQYSYPTIYSYILLRLKEAAESGDHTNEEAALAECGQLITTVYKRLQNTLSLDDEGMSKNSTVKQFRQIEETLIKPRLHPNFGLKAVIEHQNQLKLSPEDKTLRLNLVTILFQRQDSDGVVRAFEAFSETKWQDEMLVYYYANAQQQNGAIDEGIQTLERLANEQPGFFLGVFRLAQFYDIIKQDHERAARAYQGVLSITKEEVEAKYPQYLGSWPGIEAQARKRIGELKR